MRETDMFIISLERVIIVNRTVKNRAAACLQPELDKIVAIMASGEIQEIVFGANREQFSRV